MGSASSTATKRSETNKSLLTAAAQETSETFGSTCGLKTAASFEREIALSSRTSRE